MVILTDVNGNEIRYLESYELDIDVAKEKDFELRVDLKNYQSDLVNGARLFVPNTEFGGIIGQVASDTSLSMMTFKGWTWRGFLNNKIIQPPPSQDYKIVSGSLSSIISSLFTEYGLNDLFKIGTIVEKTYTNYQFDRYISLYDGIIKMIGSDLKLDMKYIEGEYGTIGHIEFNIIPIVDYSSNEEISSDNGLMFNTLIKNNAVNHLICLGKGELKARQVVNIFVNDKMEIVDTQYYTGVDEVVATYDLSSVEGETSAQQLANLKAQGIEHLKGIMNSKEIEVKLEDGKDIQGGIGDIVGGQDYISKLRVSEPITNIIYKETNGKQSISYSVGEKK